MRKASLVAVGLLLVAPQLRAQAVAPAFAPSHIRAAEALLVAMQMETAMTKQNPFLAQMGDQAGLPAGTVEAMQAFFQKYLSWDTLKPQLAQVYAEVFAEAELNELAAFYSTPLGRKLGASTPDMSARMMGVTRKLLDPHMGELMEAMMRTKPPM